MTDTNAQEEAFGRLKKKHRDASVVGRRDGEMLVTWTEPTPLGVRTKHAAIAPNGRRTEVPSHAA